MTPVNRGGETSAAYVPSENPEVFLQLPQHQQRMQEAFMDIGTFPAMHEIVSNVWLGNQTAAGILMPYQEVDVAEASGLRASTLKELRQRRISHIICCSEEDTTAAQPFRNEGIVYHSELLLDGGLLKCDADELAKANAQFAAFFAKSMDLMRTALEAGGAVLVHCNSGANRSSSVVAGYMMLTQGKRFDEVMPIIFEKRPIVCPRYWQWLVAEVEPQAVAHRYAALRARHGRVANE